MATPRTQRDTHGTDELLVLHVDDEPSVCELTTAFLEQIDERITVRTDTRPTAVLGRLSDEAFDCVVCDYEMPDLTGIEVLRDVRDEYPNLPFILFTGRGSEEVASEAVNAGVTAYVQKGGSEVYDQLAHRITNEVSRLRSERRAKIAEERLLTLYEQTDGFYILDADWQITYWNQTMVERTGRSADDVLGRDFWTVFPEPSGTDVHEFFRTAVAADEPQEFETYLDFLDQWVEIRAYPVDDGLFVHSRQVTDEKERKRELEDRNQILQSFANTVSHDLRNPLSVAEGRLELAKETGDFDHLEEVAQAHNRMRNLIDELLRLARGEELSVSQMSLRAVAEQAWKTVEAEGSELLVDGDLTIEAHESQLRRLFENLFWNAIEHGSATTVRVGLIGECGFYVEDTGTGVPEGERENVFDSGYSTAEEGAGYGLHIVSGIVDLHGWDITLTDGDAGGARFEITGIR